MGIYRKYQNSIEKILFPAILLLYPLLTINQGLDVADTTYSLANFQYFGSVEGTWMVATFLANVAGWLFIHLPFGGTMIGMYFYTSLVQSAAALMVYFALRKSIPAPLLFLGEFIALGLCWCPSTSLYNYLTYLLMTAGMLLLYHGICERKTAHFVAAGVCLGANVAVRMPNVVQAAFILAVWYGMVVTDREKYGEGTAADTGASGTGSRCLPWRRLVVDTGWCLLGYCAGFGLPFLAVCARYGAGAYPSMVRTVFAMTDQAVDYKPASMLTGMLGDYLRGMYWLAFAGICMAAGWFLFTAWDRAAANKDGAVRNATRAACVSIYTAVFLILLRFYWGRGMFTFRYYEYDYRSIYYPTVLFLLVTICLCGYCLIGSKIGREQKIFAALVLLQIFLTPLGSNNALSPIINNLFLALPFALWTVYHLCVRKADSARTDAVQERGLAERRNLMDVFEDRKVVWMIPFMILAAFVLVQSVGFHAEFVFQDGIWGEPRDRRMELPKKAAGIYTNQENGALLEELALFIQEENLNGREMIAYGELPGLHYLLDMPPALSTAWPDLDSYRMAEYSRDMAVLEERTASGEEPPVIVVSAPVAAYLGDDGEAIGWFGVDMEAMAADEKLQILAEWIRDCGYTEVFGNAGYVVYMQQV